MQNFEKGKETLGGSSDRQKAETPQLCRLIYHKETSDQTMQQLTAQL